MQTKAVIVSNNSSNGVEDFQRILLKAGIEMHREQIILAGVETLGRAMEIGSASTWVLANPRMRLLARRLGLSIECEAPDVIALLRDTRFTYQRLEKAINALAGGARLIGMSVWKYPSSTLYVPPKISPSMPTPALRASTDCASRPGLIWAVAP